MAILSSSLQTMNTCTPSSTRTMTICFPSLYPMVIYIFSPPPMTICIPSSHPTVRRGSYSSTSTSVMSYRMTTISSSHKYHCFHLINDCGCLTSLATLKIKPITVLGNKHLVTIIVPATNTLTNLYFFRHVFYDALIQLH